MQDTLLHTEALAGAIRVKRGAESLRDAAMKIGVGFATLSRIERGKTPSLEAYVRVCLWLGKPLETYIAID